VSTPPPAGYVGFVTRAVALTVDALLINAIAVVIGAAVTLIASVLGADGSLNALEAVIGGFAWLLWSAGYFTTFWTLTGQTPGDRLLGIRVVPAGGGSLKPMRALRRFVGLVISTIPLGAGFLPVLVDDKRRGLHDRIAATVVRWDVARAVRVLPPTTPMLQATVAGPGGEALPPAPPPGTDSSGRVDGPAVGLGEVGPTVLG
jgi:uncharacterized RDD family membrane protein YckC